MCLVGGTASADPQPHAAVQAVSGRLFDEQTGQWSQEDVLDRTFAPVNRMESSLLLLATIDLGPSCVIRDPSAEEARAIARGERRPPSRPRGCDKPPGKVFADIRYSDGTHDRQAVTLSRFFVGFDGKVHVPILFYRRLVCQPVELAVWTTTQKKRRVQRVEFRCAE
jgi:hypothetical protein